MAYIPSEHTIGHGKKIEYAAVQAMTSAVQIFGTTEINFPESELSATDFTNDDSPSYHKEYEPGMYEPGTVGFTYVFSKTEYTKVETIFQLATVTATRASAKKYFRITLADGSAVVFPGFITKNNVSGAQEDGVMVEAEIQVTGPRVFTPAA